MYYDGLITLGVMYKMVVDAWSMANYDIAM
jgi:hypothetical protein